MDVNQIHHFIESITSAGADKKTLWKMAKIFVGTTLLLRKADNMTDPEAIAFFSSHLREGLLSSFTVKKLEQLRAFLRQDVRFADCLEASSDMETDATGRTAVEDDGGDDGGDDSESNGIDYVNLGPLSGVDAGQQPPPAPPAPHAHPAPHAPSGTPPGPSQTVLQEGERLLREQQQACADQMYMAQITAKIDALQVSTSERLAEYEDARRDTSAQYVTMQDAFVARAASRHLARTSMGYRPVTGYLPSVQAFLGTRSPTFNIAPQQQP